MDGIGRGLGWVPALLCPAVGLFAPHVAWAATQQVASAPDAAAPSAGDGPEVVVTGQRGAVATSIEPLATLDAAAIAAAGATSIGELLRTIRGVTQSNSGAEPIFLLNAQRVSGYQDIATLPPEAIEKVEVLPEPVALSYGYPPTRRVVNFITKRRFRQAETRVTAGATTRGLSGRGNANLGLTRLRDDARLTLALEARRTDPLRLSERDILPDPDVLFDAIGNVTGAGGGEIDPALSALAGQAVTVAPVPVAAADRSTLAGFAAGANRPRAFDLGPTRTLVPENDALKVEGVLADRIGKSLAGSVSLSAERSRDRSLAGPATATLVVPAGTGRSPFAGPVLLNRYLTEADPLTLRQITTTLRAGTTLRGAVAGWRWDLTGTLEQQRISGRSERAIDLTGVNAAIAAGRADPLAPLDPALLATRLADRARLTTRTAGGKAVATGNPLLLPAGAVTVTATVEAERQRAVSSTRGPDPSRFDLARGRGEAGLALDIPIASRREEVLPFLRDLSATLAGTARQVGGFGTLRDLTYGVTWGLWQGVQVLALDKRSEAAPTLTQLALPVVRLPNVPLFDFGSGGTEIVTLIQGGNPALLAERRRVRSLALNVKPFAEREWRLSATYEATNIRDQTGTVYAITPRTEAILPDLFTRDVAGRLLSVTYQPINFYRERLRTLSLTINAYGIIGKPPGPPVAGAKPPPPPPNYYAGLGPTIRLRDRLQLRPGTPVFDVLRGETITGGSVPRLSGYGYGGINHRGNSFTFDFWYGGEGRVRSADPTADLRFLPVFKLNLGATIDVHGLVKNDWTKRLQFKIDVNNATDARPKVLDGSDAVPNRFQRDYLDAVGRTISGTLRKSF